MFTLLYIDDEPGLLEIAQLFLERTGEFTVTTALSADAGLRLLAQHDFDAIISDYQMPEMDGIELLKNVRKSYGNIPFILFTGRGREEIVIEAINNGVDFYLQKGGDPKVQFADLAYKVRQAISWKRAESELRAAYEQLSATDEELRGQYEELAAAQAELQKHEQQLGEITGTVPGVVFQFYARPDGTMGLYYVSDRSEEILGLSSNSDDFFERFTRQVDSRDREAFLDSITAAVSSKSPWEYTGRFIRPSGETIWVQVISRPFVRNSEIVFSGFLLDITDRKHAEDELRLLKLSTDRSSDEVFWIDFAGNILYVNDAACRITGYSRDEFLKMKIFQLDPDFPPEVWDASVADLRERKTQFITTRHRRKDGVIIDVEIVAVYVNQYDHEYSFTYVRDITERKRTEDSLFNSQQMLQVVLDSIPQRVFWKDRDSVFLGCNKPLALDAGFPEPADMVGKTDYDHASHATADLYRADDRQVMETGQPRINYEEPQIKPDGSHAWLRTTKVPLRNKEGKIIGVLGTYEDITERKKVEEALRETDERFRQLITSAPIPLSIANNKAEIEFINFRFTQLFGYTHAEVPTLKEWFACAYPDKEYQKQVHDRWDAAVKKASENKTDIEPAEYNVTCKDGSIRNVIISGITIEGKLLVTFIDITERREAEEALRESEEKYRMLVEHIRDGVFIIQDGRLVFYNKALTGLSGYTAEELDGKLLSDLVAPEDREMVVSRARERAQGRQLPELYEFSLLHKDGSRRIRVRVSAGLGSFKGRPASIGTFYNVTEDRRREEALRESEEKFRALVETTSDFVWEVDVTGAYTYVSPQVRQILGYEPEELLGKTPFEIMPPDETERVVAEFKRCVMSRLPIISLETKNLRKDGSAVVLETSGVPRSDEKGRFAGYRGIDRDITERKRAEEALKESEARLSSILHGSPVLQFVIDRNHRVISWNKALEEYSGIKAADMIGTDQQWRAFYAHKRPVLADLLIDGNTDAITRLYAEKLKKPRYVEGAYEATDFFPQMGSSGIWLSFTAAPLRDVQGTIIGAVETLEDVTERIDAENALREREEWTRTILDTAEAGIILVDANTHQIVDTNRKALEMIGLPRESVIGAVCHKFICPAEEGKCPVTDCGQEVYTSERVLITASGEKIPVLKTVVRVPMGSRNILVESFVDITKQKRSEAAIRETNRKLNLLNSITRHDIRNQLTAVQGYTQLAALSKPDAKVTDFLARISAAIETIQRQIEFTRAYQELGVQAPGWFLVGRALSSTLPEAIALRNTCIAVEIFADPMIDKVFFNLFDNAVKHGGQVTTVTVGCEERGEDLVITFADNGIGIPVREKQKIFEKGYGKNTGFGLFLVREILAITGITIRETGKRGKGAVFEITVPKGAFRKTE